MGNHAYKPWEQNQEKKTGNFKGKCSYILIYVFTFTTGTNCFFHVKPQIGLS